VVCHGPGCSSADYTAGEVRGFAKRAKDAAQARRLLAIAAVLDGASRDEAAKIGGMDRQTLRDWVIRFNEQGPDGRINIPSPGVQLDATHRAFLARIVEEGADPGGPWGGALAGVRSDHATARGVWALGIGRHDLSSPEGSRLLTCERQTEGLQAGRRSHGDVQKNFADRVAEVRAQLAPGTPVEVWFQDEMRVGQKNKLTYRWARKGSRPRASHDQRTPIDVSVRRGMPATRRRRCPGPARPQH
jgi:transposase